MSSLAASLYRYVSIYPVSLPFPCSKKKLFIARLPSSRCASRGFLVREGTTRVEQQVDKLAGAGIHTLAKGTIDGEIDGFLAHHNPRFEERRQFGGMIDVQMGQKDGIQS